MTRGHCEKGRFLREDSGSDGSDSFPKTPTEVPQEDSDTVKKKNTRDRVYTRKKPRRVESSTASVVNLRGGCVRAQDGSETDVCGRKNVGCVRARKVPEAGLVGLHRRLKEKDYHAHRWGK